MRAFSTIALFIASALAFNVTEPTANTVWTTSGSHTVTWTDVSTDRSNFTIVLTNQQSSPSYSQVLTALVDTSSGSTSVGPPPSGWPTGNGFQINFAQAATDLSAILAQSGKFSIVASSSASSSHVATNTGSSSPATSTSKSNDAVGGLTAHGGFIAAVALLGAVLA
jgi:hypothetical protein